MRGKPIGDIWAFFIRRLDSVTIACIKLCSACTYPACCCFGARLAALCKDLMDGKYFLLGGPAPCFTLEGSAFFFAAARADSSAAFRALRPNSCKRCAIWLMRLTSGLGESMRLANSSPNVAASLASLALSDSSAIVIRTGRVIVIEHD